MKPKLWVKQIRSVIGQSSDTRLRIRGLGLRGLGSEVVVDNTPSFRGVIKRVMHLVKVEETDGANVPAAKSATKVAPAKTTSKQRDVAASSGASQKEVTRG